MPDPLLGADQTRALDTALRVVVRWMTAVEDSDRALLTAVDDEHPGEVVVGLSTLTRLLLIELAAASGRSEVTVLAELRRTLHGASDERAAG